MQGKGFYVIIGVIVLGFIGVVALGKANQEPEPPRPGKEQSDQGGGHAERTAYGGDQPPTSGVHAEPVEWGAYETEVLDDQALHNLEHGGIYVSYRPDLPQDQIDKMKSLLFTPYANQDFKPRKILLAPRASNKSPIILSSWLRNQELESYDEEAIKQYVLGNFGKSPEPNAP
jgi:hypothetical protein